MAGSNQKLDRLNILLLTSLEPIVPATVSLIVADFS